MGSFIQLLVFVFIGVLLLWFGYSLFFASGGSGFRHTRNRKKGKNTLKEGIPGAPRTCPVCSALLERGERVKSSAFPAMGKADRLMHIAGCP
jgi:hypothetical protein